MVKNIIYKSKGISLSLETIVLLILMAIVLGALLLFFNNIFNPASLRVNAIKDKESLCLQYVSVDSGCAHAKEIAEETDPYKGGKYTQAKSALESIAGKVCGQPSNDAVCGAGISNPKDSRVQCLQSCCAIYCGK